MNETKKVGLFLAAWDIGHEMPGAPTFQLRVTVNTVRKLIQGVCHMVQAVNPPPDFTSDVKGDYSYLATSNTVHILVVASGNGEYPLPPPAIGTVEYPNFRLRMILAEDFATGTANVAYRLNSSEWTELTNLPVKLVSKA